jgi:Zn-dependent protease/CBS domain-containing protein
VSSTDARREAGCERGATMFSGAIRIGRIAGIPVGVHPLWLVIVALITISLGENYYPVEAPALSHDAAYALGMASALTLFAGIIAHEFGHAIVARRNGVEIEEIDLWLLGGVARMRDDAPNAGAELRFAVAGPAVTACLLACFAAARFGIGAGGMADWVRAFLDYQVYVNAAILAFNLLPAFPLDGGRVLRALLWMRSGSREAATGTAGRVGSGCGWVLVALGVMTALGGAPGGLWFALIGGFVVLAAKSEQQRVIVQHDLAGVTAGDVMARDPVTIADWLTAEGAIESRVREYLFSAFPVVDADGRAAGLLTLDSLRRIPPAERRVRRVREIALRDPELTVTADADLADIVMRPAFTGVGRAVVVDADGAVIGLVSTTDVSRRLRRAELLRPAA